MAVIEHPELAELNNLRSTVARLSQEIKAKQSIVKDLQSQVEIAENEKNQKLAAFKDQLEARKAELLAEMEPLEAKRHMIAEADQAIKHRRTLLETETSRLREERHMALATIEQQVKQHAARLDAIQDAITVCKSKVGAL